MQEGGEFELKPTDVFLCGHGQAGNGEVTTSIQQMLIRFWRILGPAPNQRRSFLE